jgi:CheY-like chemotaxis protein
MIQKVMLVEDTPEALGNLTDLLRFEGLEVIPATNGQEAMDKLYLYKPDLIITDLRMPKMDGFTFIEKLKSTEKFKSIPILVFSANATPENEKTCLDLGVSKFLNKPCPTEILLEAIHSALSSGSR